MTTPLTITSLNQGKIYKDWTLEVAEDMPVASKASATTHNASSILQWLRSLISVPGQHLAPASRFTAWRAH